MMPHDMHKFDVHVLHESASVVGLSVQRAGFRVQDTSALSQLKIGIEDAC
jgi:hypothetical protein